MLCNFAHQFPAFIANFLQTGTSFNRRFREETVTDILMGGLSVAGAPMLIVEFPNETVTGADMEWNFVNRSDGTFFRLLIQAKQLYGHGSIWTRHCYEKLFYTSGTGTILQATVLTTAARSQAATYPLYIFYHPERTCSLAAKNGADAVQGVNLADGFTIERLARTATTRTLRTRNKSLGTIFPHLFSMTQIFCPPTILPIGPMAFTPTSLSLPLVFTPQGAGIPLLPRPKQVRDRLQQIQQDIAVDLGRSEDGPPIPEVTREAPSEIRDLLMRRDQRITGDETQPLNRCRVTFVSTNALG